MLAVDQLKGLPYERLCPRRPADIARRVWAGQTCHAQSAAARRRGNVVSYARYVCPDGFRLLHVRQPVDACPGRAPPPKP